MLRLLFNGNSPAVLIKLNNAILPWIPHIIPEDRSAFLLLYPLYRGLQCPGKALAVEDVVPKDQRHIVVPDKFFTDNKGIRQASRPPGLSGFPVPHKTSSAPGFLLYRKALGTQAGLSESR